MAPGCMMVFGLPFLGAGVGILIWGAMCWAVYFRSGSWEEVPATIESVEFVESEDSDGDTTYGVEATYAYEYGGEQYSGSRVGILGGTSSERSFHRRRYDVLREHQDQGSPCTALVNPSDPTETVLFREIGLWMYIMVPFGLSFAGAGVFLIGSGISKARKDRRTRELLQEHGNRYWLMRDDWQALRVRAPGVKSILGAWALGIGVGVFVSMFVIAIAFTGAPWFAIIVVGLFALIAVSLILRAAALTITKLVYGTPVLYLGECPIVPGRSVPAALRTRAVIAPDRWRLGLTCTESETVQRRNKSSVVKKALYKAEVQPAGAASLSRTGGTVVPLLLEVPAGQPGANVADDAKVAWELRARARVAPWPFSARFELPVFYATEDEILKAEAGF